MTRTYEPTPAARRDAAAAAASAMQASLPPLLALQRSHGNRFVQRLVQALGEPSDQAVHQAAARGVATAGGSLPHLDRIQKSFGGHDLSGVTAHVGAEAASSAAAMNARAFATGSHVVFGGGTPDLHTAAHEAAHIVQQRGGVQLAGGVGRAGDAYERHADTVADAVVRGYSAEGLLGGGPGGGSRAVQRVWEPSTVEQVNKKMNNGPDNWADLAQEGSEIFLDEEKGRIFIHVPLEDGSYGIEYVRDDEDWNDEMLENQQLTDKLDEILGRFNETDQGIETRLGGILVAMVHNDADLRAMFTREKEAADIAWLAGQDPEAIDDLVQAAAYGRASLAQSRAVLAIDAARRNYGAAVVADWINRYGNARATRALTMTAAENRPAWAHCVAQHNVKDTDQQSYQKSIRVLAYLESGANPMAVYQADVNYAGSHDPPSRTGFVEFPFVDGTDADIHTHWNVNAKKLVSMHVQEAGVNGCELNQWPQFRSIAEAVRNAHNAAGGALAPTTNPVGGQLTL